MTREREVVSADLSITWGSRGEGIEGKWTSELVSTKSKEERVNFDHLQIENPTPSYTLPLWD